MVLSRTGTSVRWGLLGFLAVPATVLALRLLGYDVSLWGCPLKALTGIPCPTWGMTRSVVAIATLHPHQALHYHLFGPLVLLLAPALVITLASELYARQTSWVWSWIKASNRWGAALLVVLTYHSWRLQQLWATGTLQADFRLSPLGQLVHHFLQIGL